METRVSLSSTHFPLGYIQGGASPQGLSVIRLGVGQGQGQRETGGLTQRQLGIVLVSQGSFRGGQQNHSLWSPVCIHHPKAKGLNRLMYTGVIMVMDCVFHITSGLKGVPEALVLLTKLSMVDNQASRGPH